jgi:hypothetical protein
MNKKELFAKLKAEEASIIASKTASVKFADACIIPATVTTVIKAKEVTTKANKADDASEDLTDEDSILVKVVANTANFIDSHMDVLSKDAYSESIASKGTTIPHIADHKWEAASDIGDVQKVYTQEISLKELGLVQEGTTTALIFETLVKKSYNEKIFNGYKDGRIKQHSIGLKYLALKLALNSSEPEDASYKETWDAYYPSIVNKEVADAKGYFWAVPKIDVLENSAVLFGANSLTPTLELTGKSLDLLKELPTQTALVEQGENTMTELETALKEVSDLKAELKQASANATKAERERTIGILEAAKTFSLDHDTAIKAINKAKWDVEDVVDFFTSIKAEKDASTSVDTSVVPFGKAPAKAAGASNEPYIPAFLKQKEGAK